MTIKEQDHMVAQAFWERDDSQTILAKYSKDLDSELRGDMTKLGVYLHLREFSNAVHVWAAMTACRRAACMKGSDRAFNEHARARMASSPDWYIKALLKQAKDAGIDTANKYYVGGLGGHDEEHAWVSTTDDVLTVCRENNFTCEGAVHHQGYVEAPQSVRLGEDIIQETIAEELHADPVLQEGYRKRPEATARRLRGEVLEKYGKST